MVLPAEEMRTELASLYLSWRGLAMASALPVGTSKLTSFGSPGFILFSPLSIFWTISLALAMTSAGPVTSTMFLDSSQVMKCIFLGKAGGGACGGRKPGG